MKKYIIIIIVIIFFTGLIATSMNVYPDEISNNVTLIVEIGVGFIIAVIIYGISRKNESEIEKKVAGTFNIIKQREDFRKTQEQYVYETLLNVFLNLQTDATQIVRNSKNFIKFDN